MEILFVSWLCSPTEFKIIYNKSTIKPLQSVQKFYALLVNGLTKNNVNISTISVRPVNEKSIKKKFFCRKTEKKDKINYYYLPIVNFPVIRSFLLFTCAFVETFIWYFKVKKKDRDRVIICDIVNYWASPGCFLAAKILRIKTCAIVPDLPMVVGSENNTKNKYIFYRFAKWFGNGFVKYFDSFILLSELMNTKINPFSRPHMVLEGIVDINMLSKTHIGKKHFPRTILYAGGIYEKYGIKKLIDAFTLLPQQNIQLSIYGMGEMEKDMNKYCMRDPRVKYYGVIPNEEVVEEQLKATLLVNPRDSQEEFSKYSFPSKNMEYMVSGTPILTTPLPGMPQEYYDYVYLFDNETVSGMAVTLNKLLSKPESVLQEKGQCARTFVLKEKNNIVQGQKVIKFLKKLL